MSKLPNLSGKEIVRILEKLGYRKIRQRGSHIRLSCVGKRSVTVPDYKSIDRSLLRKILRDAEISLRELRDLI